MNIQMALNLYPRLACTTYFFSLLPCNGKQKIACFWEDSDQVTCDVLFLYPRVAGLCSCPRTRAGPTYEWRVHQVESPGVEKAHYLHTLFLFFLKSCSSGWPRMDGSSCLSLGVPGDLSPGYLAALWEASLLEDI